MAKWDSNLWRQVSPLLDEILELDPSARESRLVDLEKGQPLIARELRELLDLHTAVSTAGFLEGSLLPSDDIAIGEKIGA